MTQPLDQLEHAGLAELAAATDPAAVEAWRVKFLGAKGLVKAALAGVKDVAPDQRADFGQRANALRQALEAAFEHAKSRLGNAAAAPRGPALDVTEPGLIDSRALGRRHIIMRVRDDLVDVFARMGFEVASGPELEDDDHNFVKLNIPHGHPAREPIDNFYVDNPATTPRPRMLRSQTSTVQVRVMERLAAEGRTPPVRVIAPGRVYRPDTVDATHSFMFHQIEGLCIDRGVSMVDLKSTLLNFARAFFNDDAEVRLRPSFFPFTEPSAEMDLKISLRPGEKPRWMEIGGCGMVDPNVLEACGIDSETYTGFAFGMGIERIAMGRYGIPDIRLMFENDLRFLKQL